MMCLAEDASLLVSGDAGEGTHLSDKYDDEGGRDADEDFNENDWEFSEVEVEEE